MEDIKTSEKRIDKKLVSFDDMRLIEYRKFKEQHPDTYVLGEYEMNTYLDIKKGAEEDEERVKQLSVEAPLLMPKESVDKNAMHWDKILAEKVKELNLIQDLIARKGPELAYKFVLLSADDNLFQVINKLNIDVLDLHGLLMDSKLPTDLFVLMLSTYNKTIRRQIELRTEFTENTKRLFLSRVSRLVKEGYLPSNLDINIVKKRLELIPVYLTDPLLISSDADKSMKHLGFHDGMLIRVRLDLPFEELQKTLIHEMVHAAIAGQKIAIHSKPDAHVSLQEVTFMKNGLMVRGKESRFTFLNEAMTEIIAMKILEITKSQSYIRERAELQALYAHDGISWELFSKAYVENYNPDVDRNEIGPHLRDLFSKINDVKGPKYLMEMDSKFKSRKQ